MQASLADDPTPGTIAAQLLKGWGWRLEFHAPEDGAICTDISARPRVSLDVARHPTKRSPAQGQTLFNRNVTATFIAPALTA
jgi:hypothetical protein